MISHAHDIKLVVLLLICLVLILLLVQPQELKKGREGYFPLPDSTIQVKV